MIPPGSFSVGSPQGEAGRNDDEGPQRTVTFAQPFAVGRYEVTFTEWDACVADGGCNGYRPGDEGWSRGSRPAIDVSWGDAQAYVGRLTAKAGQAYPLPTQAERVYAARAGTTTPFWTGPTISTAQANYNGSGVTSVYRGRTVPMDDPSFPANPWRLLHVHGNVWEWVRDACRGSYAGAPLDGSVAVEHGSPDARRVVRGGSWNFLPELARSAFRFGDGPGNRYNYCGFRVSRAFAP